MFVIKGLIHSDQVLQLKLLKEKPNKPFGSLIVSCENLEGPWTLMALTEKEYLVLGSTVMFW